MVEVLDTGFDLLVQFLHQLVRFLGIEFGDTNHPDIKQFLNILGAYFTDELRFERCESLVNECNRFLFAGGILVTFLLIDTVFDEDFLEGGIEILLFKFGFLDFQFPFEEGFGVVAG